MNAIPHTSKLDQRRKREQHAVQQQDHLHRHPPRCLLLNSACDEVIEDKHDSEAVVVKVDQKTEELLVRHAQEQESGVDHEGPCHELASKPEHSAGGSISTGDCWTEISYEYMGGGWYKETKRYCCGLFSCISKFRVFCPGGSGCEE